MGNTKESSEAEGDFLRLKLVAVETISTDVSTSWGEEIPFYGSLLAFYVQNISGEVWKWKANHFMEVIDEEGFSNQLTQSKITDVDLPNGWMGSVRELQPGQKIKYLAFVESVHKIDKVFYKRKVLNATHQSDRDRTDRLRGQEKLEISIEGTTLQELDDLPLNVQDLFLETDSVGKEKPATQTTSFDISEYNEASSEHLPISLTTEDSGNQLIDLVNETRPQGARFAVYVLSCMEPRISDFIHQVNSYYSQDVDKKELKDQIRERWSISRSDQEWTEEEVLDTIERELNRRMEPIDTLKWPTYVLEADEVYYVGFTSDLVRRVREHQTGQGAVFTKIVPPQSLDRVFWFGEENEAKSAESKVATELTTLVNEQRENPRDNPSLRLRSWDDDRTRVFAYMF